MTCSKCGHGGHEHGGHGHGEHGHGGHGGLIFKFLMQKSFKNKFS